MLKIECYKWRNAVKELTSTRLKSSQAIRRDVRAP